MASAHWPATRERFFSTSHGILRRKCLRTSGRKTGIGIRNQSSSKWVSNVGESRTSGWAGSSTCGSNRAPSKRIPRARSISLRQPVHEGPHRPLDARLRPEEKTREVPLAVQGDGPHLLHHRVGEPPLELPGHPSEVPLPPRHRLPEIRGHPSRHFTMVGVKPLVRRGPDLGLEVVAEEPELPLYGAEARRSRASASMRSDRAVSAAPAARSASFRYSRHPATSAWTL